MMTASGVFPGTMLTGAQFSGPLPERVVNLSGMGSSSSSRAPRSFGAFVPPPTAGRLMAQNVHDGTRDEFAGGSLRYRTMPEQAGNQLPPTSGLKMAADQFRTVAPQTLMSGVPAADPWAPTFTQGPMPGVGSLQPPVLSWMGSSQAAFPPGAVLAPRRDRSLVPFVTLEISRLLDMPYKADMMGNNLGYYVQVFDLEEDSERHSTGLIQGLGRRAMAGGSVETVSVPASDGVFTIQTQSRALYLEVEHGGGLFRGQIGVCKIHRLDPRSGSVWPYMLSDKDGVAANCGIEVRVIEGVLPLPVKDQMPSPRSMETIKMEDMQHGVCALLELQKVLDLPPPRSEDLQQATIVVYSEDDRELRRIGPLDWESQPGSKRLVSVDCKFSKIVVQAPLRFGGDAAEGAIYVKIAVVYSSKTRTEATEKVGITDNIKVAWQPTPSKYHELRQPQSRNVLGTLCLAYRLVTEAEAKNTKASSSPRTKAAEIGGPVEPVYRPNGRTGHFPKGSHEEALEQAALNSEAQNRALLQRCKIADKTSHLKDPNIAVVNGYREWNSLDHLFTSMGPNPMAMCPELGPTVARSHQQTSSVMKEIGLRLPPPLWPADVQLNASMVRSMTMQDPLEKRAVLRPVICKDPREISGPKDMTWCPDPAIYAPMANMTPEDQQTLRLACHEPTQNAALMFADVNPNYRINEDVWGVLADYKTARSLLIPKLTTQYPRVKDDCLMS